MEVPDGQEKHPLLPTTVHIKGHWRPYNLSNIEENQKGICNSVHSPALEETTHSPSRMTDDFTQTSSSDDQPKNPLKGKFDWTLPMKPEGPGTTMEKLVVRPGGFLQLRMKQKLRSRTNKALSYKESHWRTSENPSDCLDMYGSGSSGLLYKGTPHSQFGVTRSLEIEHQYKLSIKQKYESEWSSLSGERESLSALYNEPVIIQKDENGSFENISMDMLLILHGTMPVILQGDSGSGKSFIAQKIMLNWASEFSIHFYVVFYLRCEELMCFSEEMNLIELLSYSCGLTSNQISEMLQKPPKRMVFIIDGFDELRLTQDIYEMSAHTNPLQKAPAEVILCSLLRGYLIPGISLLVTTRTKNTVNKLLRKQPCFTEIMGFSEKKVETYFQTFFSKEYDCVSTNESLLTACSIPVICWIVSEMFRLGADVSSGLETTTSIYVGFVSTLLEHHCRGLSQSVPTLLRSLGQLAERGMLEQQVMFDEKNVDEIISDPVANPFLCRFLSKRRIRQETMFSFMYHSFQEFFTALYYVLLDAEESQRKVRELLHTVERGWALSFWSDRDFSMADVEVRQSNLLQPVILFLCGLCKKKWIPSFFEKLNVPVSVNIETQLKEWISTYSQRYQSEHMLFILHCLYELHEKSFIRKVLEDLILIDLSHTLLKRTDCWVLKYCLRCCEHIRNLKLHVTSDNLKMLLPELSRCKQLWLILDHISDDVVGLVSAAAEGKKRTKLNINMPDNYGFHREITVSVRDGDITLSFSEFTSSATELTLTSPHSFISTINWVKSQNKMSLFSSRYLRNQDGLLTFLQSVSGLKKVCLQDVVLTEPYSSKIMSLIKACPSLIELRINVTDKYMMEYTHSMKTSLEKMGWTLTVWGKLALLKLNMERFTEGKMKTKQEKTKRGIGESSDSVLKAESSTYSFSEDVVFTPELSGDEDKLKNTYRFVCAHAGQFRCSLTNLVFVMEGEGEVLYRVDSWDPRLLDGLGQMRPAGPLYDIDCSAKSVLRLQLPHCVIFSEENKDGLAVAHFTGGNVEIIQPLRVTETHVIIDIRDLSRFGLIWIKTIFGYPIDGQVLLFLRPVTVEQEQKILNVHLLPGNVPVTEVQCFHHNKSYIETSSKCCLFTDRQYSLCCQPENCEVQPMSEIFQLDNFGPNYHPTFEVFLDVNIKEVKLGVVDKTEDGKEVWPRRRILLTAPSKAAEPPAHRRIPETEFVNTHGDKLTQRVSSVMAIADSLKTKKIITPEMWSKIHVAETLQEKMRRLLIALESGGDNAKVEFCRLLKENEPDLVKELGPHL
ncbi:NACHT, LRR and PYD domains-containing protein 1b allele 3-like [Carassius auratus]|uniref:NACHT, LRR and PYD domains-containing protein 1b allele 3-like n=1 Tax=Carassius auratus TaxID=7957 RepID=A0A6P6JNX5_CARAU|nr:NACHT, LRR and PYD domains-containing protein 1b allele 3-like [Carassius auratus]